MKMRRFAAAVVGCIVSVGAVMSFTAGAASEPPVKTEGKYKYQVYGDHVIIKECTDTTSKSITIPSKLGGLPVKAIATGAMWDNNNLESLTIPEGVTTIQSHAIITCTKLKNISFPKSLTDPGMNFGNCPWYVDQIKTGKPVIVNGYMMSLDCLGETSYTIPSGVTAVGPGAFMRMDSKKLKSITIPDSVIRLDQISMAYLEDSAVLTIPASVIYMEWRSLGYEPKLTVRGYSGSRAERFAKTYGIKFQSIGTASSSKLFSYGDVNRDGSVDSKDASAVLEEYASVATGDIEELTTYQCAAADVNSDGLINAADASKILEYYVYASTGGKVAMEKWLL